MNCPYKSTLAKTLGDGKSILSLTQTSFAMVSHFLFPELRQSATSAVFALLLQFSQEGVYHIRLGTPSPLYNNF